MANLSVIRIEPRPRPSCAGYALDAIVVELDRNTLDVRLELGSGLGIYWAVPAGPGDRLRLFHVDGAAYDLDEPDLIDDPFVFDLPRTGDQGELGQLHDGTTVIALHVEASAEPARYQFDVVVRDATGAERARRFAWRAPPPAAPRPRTPADEAATAAFVDSLIDAYARWDDPDRVAAREARSAERERRAAEILDRGRAEALAALGLPRWFHDALADRSTRVAAWDVAARADDAVSIVAVEPGFPAQRLAVVPVARAARATLADIVQDRGLVVGATFRDSGVVWAIDGERCEVWQLGLLRRVARVGTRLELADRSLAVDDVRALVSFADPARRNHRGLAVELDGGARVLIVEQADSDAAPRRPPPAGGDWDAHLGRALAGALGVPWRDDPRPPPVAPSPPPATAARRATLAPTTGALLDACRAHPDDDAPRLAWADAIGGERGELVRLQCELARGGGSLAETITRRRRVRTLLDRHGPAWSELAGVATDVRFHRGFVDAAGIPVGWLLDDRRDVEAAAPLLTALTVTGLTAVESGDGAGTDHLRALLERVLAQPVVRRVPALGVGASVTIEDDDGDWSQPLDDDVAVQLAASGLVPGLRGLAIGSLTTVGVDALAACDLSRLETLAVSCDFHRTERWAPLLATGRLPVLRALSAGNVNVRGFALGPLLDALPGTLVELALDGGGAAHLAQLASHPIARQLEHLRIGGELLGAPTMLAAMPRLRVLHSELVPATLPPALTPATVPALRELGISQAPSLAAIEAVIARLGAGLELLDLRGINPWQAHGSDASVAHTLADWAPRLAGDLVSRGPRPAGMIHLGRARGASWWDHVALR